MSRRRKAKKRIISADPVYNSSLVNMIVNRIMKHGKKALAYRTLYAALEALEQKTKEPPMKTLQKACDNVTPKVVVKARRLGGSALQIPLEVKGERGLVLAIQWILAAARARSGPSFVAKLKDELFDASKNTGAAIKRRNDVKRMADANKAYARFRF